MDAGKVGGARAGNEDSLGLSRCRTIVSLSIVYTIGQVVMAVSSINDLTDFDHNGTPNSMSVHV